MSPTVHAPLLLELLRRGASSDGLGAAEAAGADPNGWFCAAAFDGEPGAGRSPRVWTEIANLNSTVLVLAQVSQVEELASFVRPLARESPLGLGRPRQGWSGAAASCRDALDAHLLAAARGRSTRFDDDWVAATLVGAGDRLADLIVVGRDVAQRHSHLADAVRAFAEQGLSVVAASRTLHIHPNTVIYRLERWLQLTGWDARTFEGLARSMACLELTS